MLTYSSVIIKSFKHDGHLHRKWLKNWKVPGKLLDPTHAEASMIVTINSQTPIQEASGEMWISKVPGVSFFIPNTWYNIVALMESEGIRYYCNVASPPHLQNDVLTYIDYDLDVIVFPDGTYQVVDREEFERHKLIYRYSDLVVAKAKHGLQGLLTRIKKKEPPFQDDLVRYYFHTWVNVN